MATFKEDVSEWKNGALIYLMNGSGAVQMLRPAVFVWVSDDSIGWVEPHYTDPWGAATPAFHARTGRWTEYNVLKAEDYLIEVLPFDPEQPEAPDVAGPLLAFAKYLQERGTTWDEERTRIRDLIYQDTTGED